MRRIAAITLAVITVAVGLGAYVEAGWADGGSAIHGRITNVIDGNRLIVRVGSGTRRVRLLGADAPRFRCQGRGGQGVRIDPDKVKPCRPEVVGSHRRNECGGAQARGHLLDLAFNAQGVGRSVTLSTDPSQPRFASGYLLAYVMTLSGKLLQAEQIRAGWAETGDPARLARGGRLLQAERAARSNHRGVWSRCGGNFHKRI